MKKAFKIFTLVCAVVAMFAMTSCKKSQEDLIIGQWKMISVVTQPSDPFTQLIVGSIWNFNADKTMEMTVTLFGETVNEKATYAIQDGKLLITSVDEDGASDVESCDIKVLDNKNLTLYTETTDDDGSVVKMTMNFERQ